MENLFVQKVGNYNIRRCNLEDLKQVISINLTTLPEHYSDYFFEEIQRSSPESFIVAENKKEIVGYIMCRIEYGFSYFNRFSLSKKGHIVSLAVINDHRNNGLGKAMIKAAVEGLNQRGCNEVYLEVRVSNTKAVKLYIQLNFKITTVMSGYYRDNEKANIMAIKLPLQT